MSDGEVTLLETASYRLVAAMFGANFWCGLRRKADDRLCEDTAFIFELAQTLWGKERQP